MPQLFTWNDHIRSIDKSFSLWRKKTIKHMQGSSLYILMHLHWFSCRNHTSCHAPLSTTHDCTVQTYYGHIYCRSRDCCYKLPGSLLWYSTTAKGIHILCPGTATLLYSKWERDYVCVCVVCACVCVCVCVCVCERESFLVCLIVFFPSGDRTCLSTLCGRFWCK